MTEDQKLRDVKQETLDQIEYIIETITRHWPFENKWEGVFACYACRCLVATEDQEAHASFCLYNMPEEKFVSFMNAYTDRIGVWAEGKKEKKGVKKGGEDGIVGGA